jgi:hypothetical protein
MEGDTGGGECESRGRVGVIAGRFLGGREKAESEVLASEMLVGIPLVEMGRDAVLETSRTSVWWSSRKNGPARYSAWSI